MAREEDWRRNGRNCRSGHYQLDWIEANGTVHAGCHIVARDEIDRIASEIEEYEPLIKCRQCQVLGINACLPRNRMSQLQEDLVDRRKRLG